MAVNTDRSAVRIFVAMAMISGVVCAYTSGELGEDITVWLQSTAITHTGFLFIGWLIGGPPWLIAIVSWLERERLAHNQLRDRAVVVGAWAGLSMFILPARMNGVTEQFATGSIAGAPLSQAWSWAILANLIAICFAAIALLMRHSVVKEPTPAQQRLTARFLERSTAVLLAVSFGFAIYGESTELFH